MKTYNSFNDLASAQEQCNTSNTMFAGNILPFDSPESKLSEKYRNQLNGCRTAYKKQIKAQTGTTDPNTLAALKKDAADGWNHVTETRDKAITDLNRRMEQDSAKSNKSPLQYMTALRDEIITLENEVEQLKQQADSL